MMLKSLLLSCVVVALSLGPVGARRVVAEEPAGAPAAPETVRKLDRAMARGVDWLKAHQNPDGGYGPTQANPRLGDSSDIGLTAFALYALARAPATLRDPEGPAVRKAVAFVLERQQPDGSFVDPRDPSLVEYKTSVAMLALLALDRDKYAAQVERARDFLKGRQFTAVEGFSQDSPYYGGFGYGGKANLSMTKYSLEALHEAGLSAGDSVWERVQTFLSRTQNAPEVDPVLKKRHVGTTGDYGFRYGPDFTRGPESTGPDGTRTYSSYGSMTYAGLLSFLYANVDKSDPRVRGAFKWISKNFTLDINPGMVYPGEPERSLQGRFYYFHTMAKALSVYGQPFIEDGHGVRHDWARELAEKLVSLQHESGLWENQADRWMESVPELATCYALISMSYCREQLSERGR